MSKPVNIICQELHHCQSRLRWFVERGAIVRSEQDILSGNWIAMDFPSVMPVNWAARAYRRSAEPDAVAVIIRRDDGYEKVFQQIYDRTIPSEPDGSHYKMAKELLETGISKMRQK